MLPGLMPVPAILAIGGPVSTGNGTPIGLLLSLTWVPPTGGGVPDGSPIGLLLALTKSSGGVPDGSSIGLLLALTKGSGGSIGGGGNLLTDGSGIVLTDDTGNNLTT
jgi:hypothetical protein